MTINERVKELRKHLNLSMAEFGAKVGVTKVAIWNIERGNRKVTELMFKAICRAYQVNPVWLRDGVGEMLIAPAEQIMDSFCELYHLDPMDRLFLTAYVRMDMNSKKVLWDQCSDCLNQLPLSEFMPVLATANNRADEDGM